LLARISPQEPATRYTKIGHAEGTSSQWSWQTHRISPRTAPLTCSFAASTTSVAPASPQPARPTGETDGACGRRAALLIAQLLAGVQGFNESATVDASAAATPQAMSWMLCSVRSDACRAMVR